MTKDETIEPSLAETEKIKCPSCFGLGGYGLSNDGGLAERCDTCEGFGTVQPTGGVTSPEYVVVPRDPAVGMIVAGGDALLKYVGADPGDSYHGTNNWAQDVWDAMLSAAPPSPRSDDGSGLTPHSTAVSAIAQERDVGEWLPIEKAPKGRKVIVSVPNGKNRPPITMMGRYWRRGSLEVAEGFEDEDWADVIDEISYMPEGWYEDCEVEDAPAHNITPTHWMPLPSPPTTSPKAIGEEPSSSEAVNTSPQSIEVGELISWLKVAAALGRKDGWEISERITPPQMDRIVALLIALDAERGRLKKFEDAQREMQDSSKG